VKIPFIPVSAVLSTFCMTVSAAGSGLCACDTCVPVLCFHSVFEQCLKLECFESTSTHNALETWHLPYVLYKFVSHLLTSNRNRNY